MAAGLQRVSEHDRLVVGPRAAVDLLTENICFPATGLPQTRARAGAVMVRASIAITKALRRAEAG